MAENVEERCTLVRGFADFDLLPDLLVRTSGSAGSYGAGQSILGNQAALLDRWESVLADADPNMDHAEPEDLPVGLSAERFLAEDALGLTRRLGLVVGAELSVSAVNVLDIGKQLPGDRDEEDYRRVRQTLADGVRDRYIGRDGLEIVPLVLEGARLLAETDHIWASYIPGLMLVEFEALIHWAFARPIRAQRLRDELVTYRDVAMHRYGQPSPDVPPIDNLLLHADATTRLYLETEELAARTDLTVTEVRSTAMLLTYAGVLEEAALAPVHYLRPPGQAKQG